MMNKIYYYEIQEKNKNLEQNSFSVKSENTEIEQNARLHNETTEGTASPETAITTAAATTKNVAENLLNDYEIIDNNEFENENEEDDEEIVDLTRRIRHRNSVETTPSMTTRFMVHENEPSKLQLNLNATKIALKSQAKRNTKSITPEVEGLTNKLTTIKQMPKRAQHVPPLSFTIQPIKNKPPHCFGEGNESNMLPEIVLTSFEMRENAITTTTTTTTTATTKQTMKKSATVTFQTVTTPTATSPNAQKLKTTPVSDESGLFAKIVPLPPPPPPPTRTTDGNLRQQQTHQTRDSNFKFNNNNFNNNNNKHMSATTTITVAEVYDKFRRDSEDSSEINSQLGGGGNSTSPESLMDNILSAASCESESSTNSSAATEVRGSAELDFDGGRSRSGVGVGFGVGVGTLSRIAEKTTPTRLIEGTSMLINSSLNSKSKTSEFQQQAATLQQMSSPSILKTNSPLPQPPSSLAIPKAASNATTPVLAWLQPPHEQFEMASITRSRSPSPTPSTRIMPERALYPDELKCQICAEPFRDPRTLNCLHSFCFQCLVNENFKQDQSIPFWSQPAEGGNNTPPTIVNGDNEWKSSVKSNYSFRSLSPETTARSFSENSSSPSKQRRGSFSFRRKKSQDRILFKGSKSKPDGRGSENSSTLPLSTLPSEMEKDLTKEVDNVRFIICKICNFATELPVGGLRQLPQNFILTRKIEELQLKIGDEVISKVFCSLCFEETNATYHCVTCTLNLCKLCKDAHERQKPTANHKIKNVLELRRARKKQQNMLDDYAKLTLKCGMHPGFEIKSFCTVCLQVACADCLVLLHKGHKHENIAKAYGNYTKILNASIDQARPLCNYAEHSIERLSGIAKDINRKCDDIQAAVENFIQQYFDAVEAHRRTLLQQVARAREAKVEMVLEQQLELEKRTAESLEAVKFSQELCELASEAEVLSFVNILLKRLEYCQQFKAPVDPKISDSLHFLPKIVAPSTKEQNNITLYGIITMQIVEPANCTLQMEDFTQLRLHKRIELAILTRDADGVPLCHGGMLKQMQVQLKYKEGAAKSLPMELSDNRDGTYIIAFTPDAQGTLILTIYINDKPIKGSPYCFQARSVRPHSGIFHCCSFCSAGKFKGGKSIKCSCEGKMPGYIGCGHGHAGHPGRRHWSCCGNVLENSECSVANKLLNV